MLTNAIFASIIGQVWSEVNVIISHNDFILGGDNGMSICPKNKSSKARRDKRRANWKMTAPNLVRCSKCGELMMPHRVCKKCGSYNKKEILSTAEEA